MMDGLHCSPVTEPRYTFSQVTSGFILWVDHDVHVDLGKLLCDPLSQVLGKSIVFAEGVVIALLLQSAGRLFRQRKLL